MVCNEVNHRQAADLASGALPALQSYIMSLQPAMIDCQKGSTVTPIFAGESHVLSVVPMAHGGMMRHACEQGLAADTCHHHIYLHVKDRSCGVLGLHVRLLNVLINDHTVWVPGNIHKPMR